ncbi:MAG TPA: hypothetical protein VJH23_02750 [archaeon]|nr:hypothetical protein [archaeon]
MEKMVEIDVKLNEYTNRVLRAVKKKYGLKNKGAALDKFVEIYGEEYVEKKANRE